MHWSVADAITTPLWIDQLGGIEHRPPLSGDTDADVAIIGGGYSGLWTAYYLTKADPTLRIVVIEREYCGFGASGRNGGWAVGEIAGSLDGYAKRSTPQEAMRLARAVFGAVDEIGRVCEAEGIEARYAKGGTIRVARNSPQADRQRAEIEHERARGFTEDEMRLLDPNEARTYLNATDVRSGIFLAPSAALHPAHLARGLADAIERAGVEVVEGTAVESFGDGRVVTDHGTVRAERIVLATEAYTRDLPGHRLDLLPVYSLMIATEPLPDAVFDDIGLADRSTFADDRFMVIYGQRTADNRIAFGGRGVPYLWGSAIAAKAEYHEPSHELLRQTLAELLPPLADAAITHRWGGVLAIPRDWTPGLRFDATTGIGVLGGYVGEGVAAANLAGATMADLVRGANTDRTSLPWVGVKARRWEPEPFRWLGVRSSRWVMNKADEMETRTDTEATVAYKISRLLRGA